MAKARIQLPLVQFLFTLDQVAMLLNITETDLAQRYLFFEGVSTGISRGRMRARDISPTPDRRDWRVGYSEFRLFLTTKGYRVVEPDFR